MAAKYASRSWLYLQVGPYEHSPLQKALHRNAPVEERACLRSSLARLRDVFSSGPGASAAAGRSSGARGGGGGRRYSRFTAQSPRARSSSVVGGVQGEPSGFTRAGAGASASGGEHRAPDPAADRNRARARGSALGGGGGGMRAFERRSRSRVRGFGAEREGFARVSSDAWREARASRVTRRREKPPRASSSAVRASISRARRRSGAHSGRTLHRSRMHRVRAAPLGAIRWPRPRRRRASALASAPGRTRTMRAAASPAPRASSRGSRTPRPRAPPPPAAPPFARVVARRPPRRPPPR